MTLTLRMVAGLGLLLALAGQARATVLVYHDHRQLSERASVVVRGRVVAQRVVLLDGRPFTETRVRVAERLKGKVHSGDSLLVRQPGGETRTVGMRVAGTARFQVGEHVLLFAEDAGSHYLPVGLCQGKYRIYRDGKGTLRGRRELGEVSFAVFDVNGRIRLLRDAAASDPALSELVQAIRGHAGGAR